MVLRCRRRGGRRTASFSVRWWWTHGVFDQVVVEPGLAAVLDLVHELATWAEQMSSGQTDTGLGPVSRLQRQGHRVQPAHIKVKMKILCGARRDEIAYH